MDPKEAQQNYLDELEDVKFGDFGGKRHSNGDVHPEKPVVKPKIHFRLIKEWYTRDHTTTEYVGWGVLALFIGMAIASFITQAVLVVRDYITDANGPTISINGLNQKGKVAGTTTSQPSQNKVQNTQQSTQTTTPAEPRGSDDAFSTSTSMNQYKLANQDKFPKLLARAFLVGDAETGEIIYEQNPGYISPMASVSKLMTALIAHEKMDSKTVAIVSRDSYNAYGSEGGLLLGEKIKLVDLMYPLLIESSNDGAEVIADAYPEGHVKFLEEMNKKAAALGMTDTYYEDPSGLSPQNVSSIGDLFTLGRYIYKKAPVLYDMTRVKQFAILGHTWVNKNRLLLEKTFIGGKNGFIDEAKQTTVSIFNIPLAKGGTRPIMIVILKSEDRTSDAQKIITFLKKNGYYSPEVTETIDVNALDSNPQ
ncbi:MAG: hypothetical protein RL094_580 [Candidatus Parcubacteria bacterium]|jgi:D-alanyl-D-alanine carboxypeptidase